MYCQPRSSRSNASIVCTGSIGPSRETCDGKDNDCNNKVDDIRELANDLCLRTDGKITKEDLDAIGQWALKVREMYLDIESRREDAREAAVDAVNRLEETWRLFRELEPKLIVNDEQIFRELKDRYGLTVLMAEQNFHQAIRIADRSYVIVHGRIEFEGGSRDELSNNELVHKLYMGM